MVSRGTVCLRRLREASAGERPWAHTTEEVESGTGKQALDSSVEYHMQAKRGLHQRHTVPGTACAWWRSSESTTYPSPFHLGYLGCTWVSNLGGFVSPPQSSDTLGSREICAQMILHNSESPAFPTPSKGSNPLKPLRSQVCLWPPRDVLSQLLLSFLGET